MSEVISKAAKVKLVVIGVDGVLTDAGMYFNEHGDMLRKFNRRDGMGIKMLNEAHLPSAIISSLECPIVQAWAEYFDVEQCRLGVRDKFHTIENLTIKYGIDLSEVCYISDDIDEVPILRRIGFGVTTGDGMTANKKASAYVTQLYGGEGAVREVIELILYSRGK